MRVTRENGLPRFPIFSVSQASMRNQMATSCLVWHELEPCNQSVKVVRYQHLEQVKVEITSVSCALKQGSSDLARGCA